MSFPIAQDAYNFSLHYYPGDYTPISATTPVTGVLEAIPAQAAPLYNGNIAAMAVNLPLGLSTNTKVYNYHYDQLNRLVSMDAFDGLNTTNHTFSPVQLSDYQEQVGYDPNGNILSYKRNGYTGGGTAMDVLTYNYNHPATNQLSSISDAGGGTYTTDIKDQGTGDNYRYDQIGNLILDGTNTISWTVYGKILTQSGLGGPISYAYDASSNRITKTTSGGTTLYVRDAQGNVLSTYQQPAGGAFAQSEIDLFGSSRLGLLRSPTLPTQTIALSGGGGMAYVTSFTRGVKSYELSNHLGNVLATITDKKIAVSSGSNSSLIDHFTADVVTAQDYYPFGMIMPGRSFVAAGAGNYRYGFNGQEKVDEVAGVGNHTTAEFWEYDTRSGVRWNTDPKPMVGISPYAAFNGNPIFNADPLGDSTGDPLMPRHPVRLFTNPSDLAYVPYNLIGSLVNGGQALLSKAGDYIENPMVQFNNDMGSLGDGLSNTISNEVNYYKKTPGDQIWKDYKTFFSNPDNYFHAAEDAFLIVAAGKFGIPREAPPVPKISVAEEFTLKTTTSAGQGTSALTEYWPKNGGALGKWEREFLMPGTEIDRFGSGFGKYFSPRGTPMEMRALPAGNTAAYNTFKVMKPFEVQSSIIAPAFDQLGLGKQYLSPVNMNTLLKRGIIAPTLKL